MANFLTCLRIAITPAFVVLLLLSGSHPGFKFIAFGLFIFGAVTDWADGFVARHTETVSEFGKTADPLADRIFIAATLISLYIVGSLPLAFLIIIVGRDVIIALGYPFIGRIDKSKVAVHWTGKLATASIFVALALLILDAHNYAYYPFLTPSFAAVGLWLCVWGMIWSLVSAGVYISRVISLRSEISAEGKDTADTRDSAG